MKEIIEVLDKITIIFTTLTMIVVFYNFFANRKQNQKIFISFLSEKGENIILKDISIIRRHATRSEVMGLLGIIQIDSKKRYNVAYLSEKSFFDDLYAVQKGELDTLTIKISNDELEQFDL